MLHALNGAHPKRKVGMHRILDHHRYLGTAQGVGNFLNCKRTHRCSCSDPEYINSLFQACLYVLGICYLCCHRYSVGLSRLPPPLQRLITSAFKTIGASPRFPNAGPEQVHTALRQTRCSLQYLLPRLRTAWSADQKRSLNRFQVSCQGGASDEVFGHHSSKIRWERSEKRKMSEERSRSHANNRKAHKKSLGLPKAFIVPGTGLEPARPKAQPPEDCASTNFATRVGVKCPGRDSNPHALTDTWPSTMPVYQFQHLGGAQRRASKTPFLVVTPLGLEPRTLSLKVRCSNQLS